MAWDNAPWPQPPNGAQYIAAAGNLAKQLSDMFGGLGDAYQSGRNFQYQQRQQNLFHDPDNAAMLDEAIKSQNYGPLVQKLSQTGGAATAAQMLPFLQKQGQLQYERQNPFPDPNNVNSGPATSTAAAGPANITGATGSPRIPYANPAGLSATGSDSAGAETVRSLTAGIAGGRAVPDATIGNYARAIGVDPDTPLSTDQEARATRIIGNNLRGGQQPAAARNPVPQAGIGDDEGNTNQGTPVGSSGGIGPVTPAPTSGAGSFNDRFGAATGAPSAGGATGMVPAGVDPRVYADRLKAAAKYIRQQNRQREAIGMGTKSGEDQANAYDKQADAILEQLGKAGELTTEQKNARDRGVIGFETRKKEMEGEVTEGQKELASINKLANEAAPANQKIKLAQRFINDAGFYSGPLEDLNRRYKQWTVTLGGKANEAQPQEGFKKAINDLLSEQIRAMAGSGVGRVLMTEVQTMKDSIASLGITPSTNRLLLEELSRVHNAQMEIQKRANSYVQRNGHIDAGFNAEIQQYYREHPLFSERELRDPRLIAPPLMPASIARDPVKIKQWAKNNGLKDGEPFAGEDGGGPYKLKLQ